MERLGWYVLVYESALLSLRVHDIVQYGFLTQFSCCYLNFGSIELGL
jgi:hypothetical protein